MPIYLFLIGTIIGIYKNIMQLIRTGYGLIQNNLECT